MGKIPLSHFNLIYLKLGYAEISEENYADSFQQEPEPVLALSQKYKLLFLFHFWSEAL